MKFVILVCISVFSLYGYLDKDLDGVDDSIDKCPNTSFAYFVNQYGCATSLVSKKAKYSFSITNKYEKTNFYTYLNTSFLLDYTLRNYSLSFRTSRYFYKNKKIQKSFMGNYYLNSSYSFLDVFNNPKLTADVSFGINSSLKKASLDNFSYDSSYQVSYKINKKLSSFFAQVYFLGKDMSVQTYGGIGYIIANRYYLSSLYSFLKHTKTQTSSINTSLTYFYNTNMSAKVFYQYGFNDLSNNKNISLKLKYKI